MQMDVQKIHYLLGQIDGIEVLILGRLEMFILVSCDFASIGAIVGPVSCIQ